MTEYISLSYKPLFFFKVVLNQPCSYQRFDPSVCFFCFFLCLLMDRTDKKRQKAEKGGMTRSKRPSDAEFEPGPTAARTVASIHGAPAQPTTTLPTIPSVCFLKQNFPSTRPTKAVSSASSLMFDYCSLWFVVVWSQWRCQSIFSGSTMVGLTHTAEGLKSMPLFQCEYIFNKTTAPTARNTHTHYHRTAKSQNTAPTN